MTDGANIIDVSDATFETDVILQSQNTPVVVDFWAPWCGPCRMLGPVLEKLAADPALDFVLAKINVDENPQVAMRYQVQGIPAVKAFVDGEIADEFVGAQPEARVRQFVEKLIPSEVSVAFREANSLLATRHWVEAEGALRDFLDEHPQHYEAKIGLARALLAQGDGCEAQGLLENSRDGAAFAQVERLVPLARYLCQISSETGDRDSEEELIDAQFRQAGRLLQRGNLEAALDGYLEVIRQDKQYQSGEPTKIMLGIFELLGDTDPVTVNYRRELAMVLF